jgi:hypothetical protein
MSVRHNSQKSPPNTHAYRLLIFKEHLRLTSGLLAAFCLQRRDQRRGKTLSCLGHLVKRFAKNLSRSSQRFTT